MKIRIMHVVECAGGVSRYLHSLIKYIDREKYENILVCSQNFNISDFENIVDIVEQIQMAHPIGIYDLKTIVTIRKLIRKYQPDIIYAHSSKGGAIARIANLGINKPCIYNPHGWAFNMREPDRKQAAYRLIEKVMAHFCRKIICISEFERQSALSNRICADEKMRVIYNGIDIAEYEQGERDPVSRVDLGIPENAFLVGSVGRLTKQKAPDIFMIMAKKIKAQIPDAHFIMVGGGELEKEIRDHAERCGIADSLHITGWVSNPLEYVGLFDVAVLLTRWEGFGLVIPEYMLCRKPVVATMAGAVPNIVTDHENGLLVQMDDAQAACDAVLELYHDDSLKEKLIEKGIEDVYKKYDVKRVAREHEALFVQIEKPK